MKPFEEVYSVYQLHKPSIMMMKGVNGVDIGLNNQHEICIRVYVENDSVPVPEKLQDIPLFKIVSEMNPEVINAR